VVFHTGTKSTEVGVVTNGGRVIALTGLGRTMTAAVKKSQKMAKKIKFKKKYFRKDIGLDLMKYLD
jgi:phosphoribosylamine--glycine ligase